MINLQRTGAKKCAGRNDFPQGWGAWSLDEGARRRRRRRGIRAAGECPSEGALSSTSRPTPRRRQRMEGASSRPDRNQGSQKARTHPQVRVRCSGSCAATRGAERDAHALKHPLQRAPRNPAQQALQARGSLRLQQEPQARRKVGLEPLDNPWPICETANAFRSTHPLRTQTLKPTWHTTDASLPPAASQAPTTVTYLRNWRSAWIALTPLALVHRTLAPVSIRKETEAP